MSSTFDNLQALSKFQNSKFQNPFDSGKETKQYTPKKEYQKKERSVEDDIKHLIDYAESKDITELSTSTLDGFFNELGEDDENSMLRANLINQGRKYARTHDDNGTTSEVDRAFNPQITMLNELLNVVSKDVVEISNDINDIRMMHSGRNYMRLNDLMATKAQLHNTSLQVIKQLSSIEKDKFDVKAKLSKDIVDTDPNMMSGNILQNIFGIGHSALLESVGGREGSSGAGGATETYDDTNSDEYGEVIYNQEYPNTNGEETDGDKYLKYENRGVEMVLEESDDGTKRVYAEDAEGNVIDDYPIPADAENLTFDINRRTGVAIDQLQRKYKYKSV